MSLPDKQLKEAFERQLRHIKYIRDYISNTKKSCAAEERTPAYIDSKLKMLNNYWNQFSDRHELLWSEEDKILKWYPATDYFKKDPFLEVEDQVARATAELTSWLPESEEEDGGSSQRNQEPLANQAFQIQHILRAATEIQAIPALQIPTFSGRFDEWESFKYRFEASVINKSTYSDGLKLHYLIDAMRGSATEMLKGVKPDATNFLPSWKKLCRRFDNPKRRLTHHTLALINLKPVTEKSATKLNELLDKAEESIQGFKDLSCPIEHWDTWFVHCIVNKLDHGTREAWEMSQLTHEGFSKYSDLRQFIENRIYALDTSSAHVSSQSSANSASNNQNTKSRNSSISSNGKVISANVANVAASSSGANSNAANCSCCSKQQHSLHVCPTFTGWNQKLRFDFVKQHKLCLNCFRGKHRADKCTSKFRCKFCHQPHHSLLHINSSSETQSNHTAPQSANTDNAESKQGKSAVGLHTSLVSSSGLLATAKIIIQSPSGEKLEVRALIDPCAERSFVSERVVQLLNLNSRKITQDVCFLGGKSRLTVRSEARLTICSKSCPDFRLICHALVLSELTRVLPANRISNCSWAHIAELDLADPEFASPQKVDCVLAADIYSDIILPGLKKGPQNTPVAQQTVFGWILTGATQNPSNVDTTYNAFHVTVDTSLSQQLQKFWEVEEVPCESQTLSPDEKYCEEYFQSTVSQTCNGRIIVRLPFTRSTDIPSFHDSRNIAIACLQRSELRRRRDHAMDKAYKKFMQDYEELGHMEKVTPDAPSPTSYMPHHAVFRPGSNKIRVVFNASQRNGNGYCLNDFLLAGPKLQMDIAIILTRWRAFKFVFTTDIVKMYRQFLVHQDDCKWQAIVWRDDSAQQIMDFLLRTITYGTKCAPFLALRCLSFLAERYGDRFPLAAIILKTLMYVDDAFGGADTIVEARQARDQLVALLQCAQMSLDKWAANSTDLLQGLAVAPQPEVTVEMDDVVSTLGLKWMPQTDHFFFKVDLPPGPRVVTKRSILSEVAKLFDPLGWLSPFLVQCKIILRKAWIKKLDWDTPVDSDLEEEWQQLRSQMPELTNISIPRWTQLHSSTEWIMHGFGDASETAYAAAVYLTIPGRFSVLLMSKNKVAPAKTLSVPRLELCAAVLLVRLVHYLVSQLSHKPKAIHCWSDSKVVLDWLASSPARWQTFVANRVSQIVRVLPEAHWAHTPTQDNPADLATRGVTVEELRSSQLWWHGPHWITCDKSQWPEQSNLQSSEPLEVKAFVIIQQDDKYCTRSFEKFSSFHKLVRIVAFMLRWKNNARRPKGERHDSYLSAIEYRTAKFTLFKLIQRSHYKLEIDNLSAGKTLPNKSQLRRLSPFICPNGLLRVGGRLQNAPISYDEAHPIILSAHSLIVKRMIEQLHQTSLHGGPQLMLSKLYRQFWIPRVTRLVQGIFRRCIRCVRFSAQNLTQQMAPLPSVRVTPQMAFQATGVDYAGPIPVLACRARGSKTVKGYFAIFICMFSRAVHIEVVSDLTTEAFLAAFRRFVSRRGRCSHVYSDNGRNFTGASRELRQLFGKTSSYSQEIVTELAKDEVEWHFSPPRSPHFGGLWERAVRSFKHHLYRVLGDSTLTFEELSTLTTQIEACLNSRPICPLSSEGSDLVALTPAHFLIGRPMSAVPEPFDKLLTNKPSCRWRLIQHMRNDFWHRWRAEVLHHHQQRGKWLDVQPLLQINDVVLIKDELTPPTKWPLGRVTALHQGKDGLVRVVDVKTASSLYRRALDKLIRLPTDQENCSGNPEESDDEDNEESRH